MVDRPLLPIIITDTVRGQTDLTGKIRIGRVFNVNLSDALTEIVTISLLLPRRPNQLVVATTCSLRQSPLQAQIGPVVGVSDIGRGR